ncbi:MAG: MBL fold metallo-hydrolase [Granulosicoccus sp.]
MNTLPVSFTVEKVPAFGLPVEVAKGIWLIRLSVALAMDHVNVYLLDNGDSWTMIDTGTNSATCRSMLETVLSSPDFAVKPLGQVIVTHFHSDHIGLAGHFTANNTVHLLTSRTCWQTTWMLHNDRPTVPHDANVDFFAKAGMKEIELESFKRLTPRPYADGVEELPRSYTRLSEPQELSIGDRKWTVRMGYGHADEHVTLWSDDNIAIVGDQILPAISPNISVHFSEPEADCLSSWLQSCVQFEQLAKVDTLCLPGHNRPYTGAPFRCRQLRENCEQVISRIEAALSRSKTAIDLMADIYRRDIASNERTALIGETMGYLNHLHQAGVIRRRVAKRRYVWKRS